MGDIKEFVTTASHGRMCFKITGSGLNFDVKSSEYATLGLSREPGKTSDVLITIGSRKSWIRNRNGDGIQIGTPGLISSNEYRRFWVLCTADIVAFGKNTHAEPILKYPCKSPKCMYVAFLSYEAVDPVYWKVELPPSLKQPPLKKINKGVLRWVPTNTQLPDDALIGGFEKENLYIMRANYERTTVPGKFVPSKGSGFISWDRYVREITNVEVLCGYDCKWVSTNSNRIPVGAVGVGCSEFTKGVLHVSRAFHNGYLIPGNLESHGQVCHVPYRNDEICVPNFEILTVSRDWRCVNKNKLQVPNVENLNMRQVIDDEYDLYEIQSISDSEYLIN